ERWGVELPSLVSIVFGVPPMRFAKLAALSVALYFLAPSLISAQLLLDASAAADRSDIERKIDALLKRMTLEEKIGQLQQLDGEANGNARPEHLELARRGLLGSTLNIRGARLVNEVQRAAIEQSRLKIPLLFAFDVIHGYRTILPIPLGLASSWDPAVWAKTSSIAALEAS